jgi:septal ring factor EnvC (AmiA/AmiB activator)
MNYLTKTLSIFLAIALMASPIFFNPQAVFAKTLQEQLEEIEDQLKDIRGEKNTLQQQINEQQRKIGGYSGKLGTLQAEIESYQLEVAELELQIKELEVSIDILKEQIKVKENIITERVEDISGLEVDTQQRIRSEYAAFRVSRPGEQNIFASVNMDEYFKASQYRQLLQKRTNAVMEDMVEQKKQLEHDKLQLREQKTVLDRDREVLQEQRRTLNKKRELLESEIKKYYGVLYSLQGTVQGLKNDVGSLSRAEAKKKAEAEKIKQAIFNNFNPIKSGTWVVKGTMIGRQGSTGLATGPHVHFSVKKNGASLNPCAVVPGGRFGNCGGNGKLAWPLQGAFYYTSGWGNRCIAAWGYCSFHDAIDIAHSTWNAPIFAAHDGYLYKGKDQYGALYAIICQTGNCNVGYKTGYWHMSSY